MEGIQKALYEAQNDTALQVIKVIRSDVRDVELINALSHLLKDMQYDPKLRLEMQKLAIALLKECEEEVDPQLITATANLMKRQV